MSFNVLIVDDSQFVRKILLKSLSEIFSDKNPVFKDANNGEVALELIQKNSFDLAFFDLTMPIMDGFQLLKELKKQKIKLPVIVLSADVQEFTADMVNELGVLGFMNKPFNYKKAVELLTELKIL
ncbi:MAG: response regulator [Spirochaetaceae bacterium]